MIKEHLEVRDASFSVLGLYPRHGLPLAEEAILRKSIEFFDDPEPCFIHRGAVMTRLTEEIWEYFREQQGNGKAEIPWELIPSSLKTLMKPVPDGSVLRIVRC